MVVEDSTELCQLYQIFLESLGWQVVSAYTGQEALELLAKGKYETFFLDQELPDMTGLEIAEKIRQEFPQQPIYLITGHSSSLLHDRFGEMPAITQILQKPVTIGQFQQVLPQ